MTRLELLVELAKAHNYIDALLRVGNFAHEEGNDDPVE